MIHVARHEPGVRLGVDACPGVDTRGHGLTMAILHSGTCCQSWEADQAARAEGSRCLDARSGPEPAREAEAGLWHSSP
jgi:hypothetical protein